MYEGKEDETEPDWVNSEREQFAQFRDKDGDGFMDKEEVGLCFCVGFILKPFILQNTCSYYN